jgi:hypothetical protein
MLKFSAALINKATGGNGLWKSSHTRHVPHSDQYLSCRRFIGPIQVGTIANILGGASWL